MRPPHAAAKLALEKKTLMKKHWVMVARQNTSRKTKITDGSLYCSTLPYCGERYKKSEQDRNLMPKELWGLEEEADYLSRRFRVCDYYSRFFFLRHSRQSKRVFKGIKHLVHQYFWHTWTLLQLTDILLSQSHLTCHSFALPVWWRTPH